MTRGLRPETAITWGALAAFAISLLVVALGPHRIGDSFAETDFYGGYVEGARLLLQGHVDPTRYGVVGPGYDAALALGSFLSRDLLTVAELLSVLAATVGIALWVSLIRRRVDPRLALVAALFMVTNPTLFRYGYSATNDALAFALLSASMFALLVGVSPLASFAAGGLAALAFLTRYPAGVLLLAGVIAILAGGTLQPRRGPAALTFVAGFLLPVVPWVVYCLSHGGGFTMQFHHDIAFDVYARSKGMPWDDYQEFLQPQFKSIVDVVARDPLAVLRREAFNVVDHLRLDATLFLGLPAATCALAGVWLAPRDRALRALWPVALLWALHFFGLVPFFPSERYSIPLLPFYAALAAAPFASPRLRPLWGRLPVVGWALIVAIPITLSAIAVVRETQRALANLPLEALETASTLRRLAGPAEGVICRKPHVAYHGGLRSVPFPFTRTLPELAAYARARGARWLYFSRFEAEMRPPYLYLLDTTASIPGLVRRHESIAAPAVLYEITGDFGREPGWLLNDTLQTLHAMRAKLRLDPADRMALLRLAEYDLLHGRADLARPRLELATAKHPSSGEAWTLLGHVALELHDPERATLAYRQAAALDPNNLVARLGVGWARLGANDLAGAGEAWRPLVLAARDPATLQQMVLVFHALGDTPAEREAQAAIERTAAKP